MRSEQEVRVEIERRNSWQAAAEFHDDAPNVEFVKGQIAALEWVLTDEQDKPKETGNET